MEDLASQICTQVGKLREGVDRLGTAQPSIESGIPAALNRDVAACAARQNILALIDELRALLSDPEQLLGAHTNPAISTNALCQLGLVKTLPLDSPGRRVQDMAQDAGVPVRLAKRLFKHAAVHHVFAETSPGLFCHTAASKLLLSDPDCQKWLRISNDHVIPASFKIASAAQQWHLSEEPHHTGWNIEHGSHEPVFEHFDKLPEQAEQFAATMRFFSKHPGFHLQHLFASFDWTSLSGKRLTDVGGSAGHASIYLAERVPGLQCIVQDRAQVIDQAQISLLSGLADRLTFEPHDMFQHQPRASDAFLLRQIFHDWSATYAKRILEALIPGMKTGTKLLVQDILLPSYDQDALLYHQQIGRALDLNMMGLQNGQERDLDDWRDLLAETSERFCLTGVHHPEGSILSLLEITWT